MFDVYREMSLYCIYSTPYCTGYSEMNMFQLIWKTKSDYWDSRIEQNLKKQINLVFM